MLRSLRKSRFPTLLDNANQRIEGHWHGGAVEVRCQDGADFSLLRIALVLFSPIVRVAIPRLKDESSERPPARRSFTMQYCLHHQYRIISNPRLFEFCFGRLLFSWQWNEPVFSPE